MGLLRRLFGEKEASGVCDICNSPTATSEGGKVYSASQMRKATNRGFNGMAVGPNADMLSMVGIGANET